MGGYGAEADDLLMVDGPDGYRDMAVISTDYSAVYVINKSGTQQYTHANVNVAHAMARVDFDHDGREDDFALGAQGDPGVQAFKTTDGLTWSVAWTFDDGGADPWELVAADADLDGYADDIISSGQDFNIYRVSALNETGATLWQTGDLGIYHGSSALADVNLDGRTNLIVSENNEMLAYEFDNFTTAYWTINSPTVRGDIPETVVSDLDNDGIRNELVGDIGRIWHHICRSKGNRQRWFHIMDIHRRK